MCAWGCVGLAEGEGGGHGVVVFGVVVDDECCGLVLLPGLSLASVAFLPEGEVEVMAIEAKPISLSRLRVAPR